VVDWNAYMNEGKMKMKKLLAVMMIAITMCGCLSSVYHLGGENDHPYNGTADCWSNCLGVWWRTPVGKTEIAMDAYTRMVYPFWIVDFPLEIVADTAFLPFDAIIMCCDDGKENEIK